MKSQEKLFWGQVVVHLAKHTLHIKMYKVAGSNPLVPACIEEASPLVKQGLSPFPSPFFLNFSVSLYNN